jgi:hypothetical protein
VSALQKKSRIEPCIACAALFSSHLVFHVDIDIDDLASRHGGGGGGGGGAEAAAGRWRERIRWQSEEEERLKASIMHTKQTGVRLTANGCSVSQFTESDV